MRFDHIVVIFAHFAIQPPSAANPANSANRHPKPKHLAGTLGVLPKIHRDHRIDADTPF